MYALMTFPWAFFLSFRFAKFITSHGFCIRFFRHSFFPLCPLSAQSLVFSYPLLSYLTFSALFSSSPYLTKFRARARSVSLLYFISLFRTSSYFGTVRRAHFRCSADLLSAIIVPLNVCMIYINNTRIIRIMRDRNTIPLKICPYTTHVID